MSDLKERIRRGKSQKEFPKSLVRNDHLMERSFLSRINWLNCTIVFGVPLLALYGVCTVKTFVWQTWLWAFLFYLWTGLCVTAGYHRLWSHGAFTTNKILELFLMIGGTGSLQGSIKWWCLLHRAHYRWTDTDSDPYNYQRWFFYAHVGWLLFDNIHVNAHLNMKDLKSNSVVRWQHNNYFWFGPFMSLIFPTIVVWWFYYLCEGYHNFHHEYYFIIFQIAYCANYFILALGKCLFEECIHWLSWCKFMWSINWLSLLCIDYVITLVELLQDTCPFVGQ